MKTHAAAPLTRARLVQHGASKEAPRGRTQRVYDDEWSDNQDARRPHRRGVMSPSMGWYHDDGGALRRAFGDVQAPCGS
jgi:hypothetical protein